MADTTKRRVANIFAAATLAAFCVFIFISELSYKLSWAADLSSREDVFHNSDVVVMYQERPQSIKKYRIDAFAWGNLLLVERNDTIQKRRLFTTSCYDAGVRLFAIDIDMVVQGGRFIIGGGILNEEKIAFFKRFSKNNKEMFRRAGEFGIDLTGHSVLDINNEAVWIPWLYKSGQRIPMASIFDPVVRQWYANHIDVMMETGANVVHFDEPWAGSVGLLADSPGDFSPASMAAFRNYLASLPAKVLRSAGISGLEGFDYRKFVQDNGGTPKTAPLWDVFYEFQLKAAGDLIKELGNRARQKSSGRIYTAANANTTTYEKIPVIEAVDYLAAEVPHDAKSRRVSNGPLLTYKLADAFGKHMVAVPIAQDWHSVQMNGDETLAVAWIATAYAFGHHVIMPANAPDLAPDYIFKPETDKFASLAAWIKNMRKWLDGFVTYTPTAVVTGVGSLKQNLDDLKGVCSSLAAAQAQYKFVLEGDDLFRRRVGPQDVVGCRGIIIGAPSSLSGEVRARISQVAGSRPLTDMSGFGSVPGWATGDIRVSEGGIFAVVRTKPDLENGAIVLHLLNRDYDRVSRSMKPKGPFSVVLNPLFINGRKVSSVTLFQPTLSSSTPTPDKGTAVSLDYKMTYQGLELTVPSLELWGIAAVDFIK